MDQIDVIIADLDAHAEAVAIDLALEITAELRITTPVLTGWARANWVPSLGDPYDGGSAAVQPTPGLVTTAMSRQNEGLAQVLSYRLAQGPIWVTNNVPYIHRLNEGWSQQAPSGFVQAAVARAVQTVRGRA